MPSQTRTAPADRSDRLRSLMNRLPSAIGPWTRRLGWATLAVQIGIVGTGGLVRLTGSGLGCPTWPRCTADSFVNTPEMGVHGVIEFGNRLLTFVLVVVAIATFLAVLRTGVTGRGLRLPAVLIGLGIPAQAVIGGISVRLALNPWVVGLHFVLSAAMVATATLLVWRMYHSRLDRGRRLAGRVEALAAVVAALTAITVLIGVLVTGSGPHAGDHGAARNGFDPEFLQHLHSWPAYALLAAAVALVIVARRLRAAGLVRWSGTLLAMLAAQIVLGLAQARLGLPPFLVGAHMVLACLVVAAMTATVLSLRQPPARVADE